jgi:hypothetical protein
MQKSLYWRQDHWPKNLLDYLQKKHSIENCQQVLQGSGLSFIRQKNIPSSAFQNNAGGFELRGPYFKGSSSQEKQFF